jgi:hypothetical protein
MTWLYTSAAALLVIVGQWWYIGSLRDDLSNCDAAKRAMAEQVEDQNKEVDRLQQAGAAVQIDLQNALIEQRKVAQQRAKDVQMWKSRIYTSKSSDCGSAVREIRESLK